MANTTIIVVAICITVVAGFATRIVHIVLKYLLDKDKNRPNSSN